MQKCRIFILSLFAAASIFTACNNNSESGSSQALADSTAKEPKWKEENVTYTGDSVTMNGYIVYNENNTAKRPAVLVVHEWWGLTDYPKFREGNWQSWVMLQWRLTFMEMVRLQIILTVPANLLCHFIKIL